MDFSKFDLIWIEFCSYLSKSGIPGHKHTFFHFLYVESGTGSITIGEETHSLIPGNIYLVPPMTNHTFFNDGPEPLQTLEIKFRLMDADTACAIRNFPCCLNVKDEPVKSTLRAIRKESFQKLPLSSEVIGFRFQLLLTYLQRCHEGLKSNHTQKSKTVSPEIEKVITHIQEHISEDFSLENLAEIAGFEKNYFLRKFKKQTGCTPMVFIRDARLEKAKELLKFSDMSITQIAFATGFKSIHYFSKVFYENLHVRPLEYRNAKG